MKKSVFASSSLKRMAILLLLLPVISCDLDEDNSAQSSHCKEMVQDAQLRYYGSEVEYIESVTFSRDELILRGRYPEGTSAIRVNILNFSLQEGRFTFGTDPKAKVFESNAAFSGTYTTDHTQQYNTSYPVTPGGTFQITDYNRDCLTISGNFHIEAWKGDRELNRDVRIVVSGSFKNIPLDGKEYTIN